jgi:hypothetical protein
MLPPHRAGFVPVVLSAGAGCGIIGAGLAREGP